MKILFIPSWFPTKSQSFNGIFIKKHAKLLAETHDVTVLYFDYENKETTTLVAYRDAIEDNLRVVTISINVRSLPFKRIVQWVLTLFTYFYYVILKKKIKYDVINLNVVYHIGIYLYPFLKWTKKPLVITEHWTGYFDEDGAFGRLGFITRMLFSKLFKKAKTVIAISHSIKNRLDHLFHTGSKTVIIPNVLNAPDGPRPVAGLDPGHFDFLVISNFDNKQKGLTGILDAFAEVSKSHPQVRLTMAGNGKDFDLVKAHAASLGLTGYQVVFLGHVSNTDIPQLYKKAHCYILNSRFETFSISTAEALLHGVPVVSTRCNGPEEYVDEKMNGVLISVDETESIQQSLIYIIVNFSSFDSLFLHQTMISKYCIGLNQKFNLVFNS